MEQEECVEEEEGQNEQEESEEVEESAEHEEEQEEDQNQTSNNSSLSQEQLDDIDLLFSHEILSNAKLTFEEVRNTMKDSFELVTLLSRQRMVRKVYHRIKYLQSVHSQQSLLSFQQEDEDREVATSSWVEEHNEVQSLPSSRTRREQWPEKDAKLIKHAFSKYDTRPSKKEIETIFLANSDLDEIRKRKGFDRCYNKVKNLFRS